MPAGPPKGNANALKTGRYATTSLEMLTGRHSPAFQTAKLPEAVKHITKKVNALRKTIEWAVFAAKGEIDIVDAATIQTIVRAECHARLCSRWLLDEFATLTVDQKANLSRECHRASAERDKARRRIKRSRSQPSSTRPNRKSWKASTHWLMSCVAS
jgi:hypothetical protein